jgi:hypothetical protein
MRKLLLPDNRGPELCRSVDIELPIRHRVIHEGHGDIIARGAQTKSDIDVNHNSLRSHTQETKSASWPFTKFSPSDLAKSVAHMHDPLPAMAGEMPPQTLVENVVATEYRVAAEGVHKD